MLTIKIDARQALRDLEEFKRSAIPFAIRNSLNTSAFELQKIWRGEIRRTFINRNTFTERSIHVQKARGGDPNRMISVVGSITDYLDEQESGGTVRGKGAHKPIPGPSAAGQSPGTKRTKLVMRSRYLGAIKAQRATGGRSARARNVAAMLMARRKGAQYVLLERPGGGKGLFLVSGGQRRFTGRRFTMRALKTRLLWDLSRSSVRVPPEPTLQRSLSIIEPKLPHIHLASLVEQCQRHGLFKG
jgi:hypothetical protein